MKYGWNFTSWKMSVHPETPPKVTKKWMKEGEKSFRGVQITWSSLIGGQPREIFLCRPCPHCSGHTKKKRNGCEQQMGKEGGQVWGNETRTREGTWWGNTIPVEDHKQGARLHPFWNWASFPAPSGLRSASSSSHSFTSACPASKHRSHSSHPALAFVTLCSRISYPVFWFEIAGGFFWWPRGWFVLPARCLPPGSLLFLGLIHTCLMDE